MSEVCVHKDEQEKITKEIMKAPYLQACREKLWVVVSLVQQRIQGRSLKRNEAVTLE